MGQSRGAKGGAGVEEAAPRTRQRHRSPPRHHQGPALKSLTLAWPVDKAWPISQGFGESLPELATAYAEYDGHHNGIDIACPIGTAVHAAANGTVVFVGVDPYRPARGTHIVLEHAAGYETYYLHLSALWVGAGTDVAQGDVIAQSGDSGGVAAHLHFGLRDVTRFEELPMRGYCDAALFVLD